jgi:hypothetical protein
MERSYGKFGCVNWLLIFVIRNNQAVICTIKSKLDKAIFLNAYRHSVGASEVGKRERADIDPK